MSKERIIGIVVILIILISTGAFFAWRNMEYRYVSIDKVAREKLEAQIKENIGGRTALQTSNCRVDWVEEGLKDQVKLSDNLFKGMVLQGELKGKVPKTYIIAYCNSINIFIPYKSSNAQDKIILEANGKYYIAKARKEDVNAVIEYLKKQKILK